MAPNYWRHIEMNLHINDSGITKGDIIPVHTNWTYEKILINSNAGEKALRQHLCIGTVSKRRSILTYTRGPEQN